MPIERCYRFINYKLNFVLINKKLRLPYLDHSRRFKDNFSINVISFLANFECLDLTQYICLHYFRYTYLFLKQLLIYKYRNKNIYHSICCISFNCNLAEIIENRKHTC